MTEEQNQNESLADRTIRRYRGAGYEESTLKRRRFTGGLFIANLILIVILYAVFSDKNTSREYLTSSFTYNGLQFRLSMTTEKETRDYIFSLTTRPLEGKRASMRFNPYLADLAISHGPTVILTRALGKNVTMLDLNEGDADARNVVVETHELKLYADAHPEAVVSPGRSLFRGGTAYLPLSADVRVHAGSEMGTSLNFRYEVEQ